MKTDLDHKLEGRADFVERMETHSQRVISATTPEIVAKWQEDVARERTNHAAYVNTIATDELRGIKEEFDDLLEKQM